MFYIYIEIKCGNNMNYMNSLIIASKLQCSVLDVTLFSIQLLSYSSVITIPTILFCSDILSVAIIVSVCDLSN